MSLRELQEGIPLCGLLLPGKRGNFQESLLQHYEALGLWKIEAVSMLRVITDIRNRQKSENAGNNDDAELTYKKPIVKIRLNDSENAAEANKKSLQYR